MKTSLSLIFLSLTTSTLAALAVLPGCGGQATSSGSSSKVTSSTEAPDSGVEDGGPNLLNGGGSSSGGGSASGGGSGSGGNSVIGQTTCNALEATAESAFGAWAAQHETCSADSDCTQVIFTESSYCASACGWIGNQGAASAIDVATQDCAAFNALGCTPPRVGCPFLGAPICANGTCEPYKISLDSSGSFVHGTCLALTEKYEQSWVATPAPRDLALSVTVTNGTLFADAACTTSFTSLTLPKGSSSVAFGFIPTAAGSFSISVDGNKDGGMVANAE